MTMTITDVATIAVPVSDQDKAVEFYLGNFGFEKRMDATFGPGLRWIEVAPPGAATSVALVVAHPGSPAGVDTGIRLNTTDAEAEHALLRSRGVDVDEILRMGEGVPPMFVLRDPDGNTLYLVERA
jgi:predicted enzyme related to lactoylglutathione lyase